MQHNPNLLAGCAWTQFAPHSAQSPVFAVAENGGLVQRSNGKRACFGSWRSAGVSVEADAWYAFELEATTDDVRAPQDCLHAMATWQTAQGGLIQRDYIPMQRVGDKALFHRTLPVPRGAEVLVCELCFKWSETGSVQWRQPLAYKVPAPLPRRARIAAAFARAPGTDREANLAAWLAAVDNAAAAQPDLLLLSETILDTGISLAQAAVALDGPEVAAFCHRAAQHRMYIVVGLALLEDGVYHNCALLIDRQGHIAGIHRKLQLPLAEMEMGFTPGDEIAVFETDFARMGMMICWDYAFPEIAGRLARQGAELLLVPSLWNAPLQAATRAADNGVFFALSAAWHNEEPVRIFGRDGKQIASARGGQDARCGYCVADIDFNAQVKSLWFSIGEADGEHWAVLQTEHRRDILGP